MSSGTLRAEAICCALALPASSSRCDKPASSALSACARPRPSSGEIAAAAVVGVVGLVRAGVAAGEARCGSGLLRARGELRPAAGEASSAGRAAFCAGLRRGFAVAGEGESTGLASEAGASFPRSAAARRAAVAWRVFLAGLELATMVGSSSPLAAAGSAFAIGVSGDSCTGSGPADALLERRRARSRSAALPVFSPTSLLRPVAPRRPAREVFGREGYCGRPCRRSKMSSQGGRVPSPTLGNYYPVRPAEGQGCAPRGAADVPSGTGLRVVQIGLDPSIAHVDVRGVQASGTDVVELGGMFAGPKTI